MRPLGRFAIVTIFALALAVPSFASVCLHCASTDVRMLAPCCAHSCPMQMKHVKPAKIGAATTPKRFAPCAPVATVAVTSTDATLDAFTIANVSAPSHESAPRFILFSQLLI